TEHPKLFILETQRGRTFKAKSKISVNNLDIFAYVNSKFVYVEKHIKNQLTKLYTNIMEQKCALEKQILQNALSFSSTAPDEKAFRIMKTPGYTAVTAGEVIHLIKCIPVECRARQTNECHYELPVTYQNQTYFLTPRSRILVKSGTPRDCNELLPIIFKIHDSWFRSMPRLVETIPPPNIQPLTRSTWKYVNPAFLATSGIYSSSDLERLRSHELHHVEKPSMLNTIARGAIGQRIPEGSISMINLLDEKSLDKIAESAGARIWKGFITFGSASAGVLAVFIIARLAKLIIDTIIHGYALHSFYGCGIHLLAAIWSSVTHLILHLARPMKTDRASQPEEQQPAETFPTTKEPRPIPPSTSENQHSAHKVPNTFNIMDE
ncbi:hypothetical protein HN011_009617, partial [Eciton burchellii]